VSKKQGSTLQDVVQKISHDLTGEPWDAALVHRDGVLLLKVTRGGRLEAHWQGNATHDVQRFLWALDWLPDITNQMAYDMPDPTGAGTA